MKLNQTFKTLLKEAAFTKEILGEGATQIRKANYAKKGVYFLSFTSLSTGLERIGKLCLMLDYYIDNSGNFPNFNYLKNEIGHDLTKIYSKSRQIISTRFMSFEFPKSLDSEIHQSILSILSSFAMGDRYSNINFLVKTGQSNDPVKNWHISVDNIIYEKHISPKRKKEILANAQTIDKFLAPISSVLYIDESDNELTNIGNASFQTGFNTAVAPYRQLYVLQIIRYWVELLNKLQHKAMELKIEDIPHFTEIFALFYNSNTYFKTRKNWNKDF